MRWRAAAIALALVALALAIALGTNGSSHPSARPPGQAFDGPTLPGTPAPGFTLARADGGSVTLAQTRGRVVVVAFLDTSCRACFLIAEQIRGAIGELSAIPAVLLVSVDPALDTAARSESFLSRAGLAGKAAYLNGPTAALSRAWSAYRVRTPGAQDYEAALPVYVLDRSGDERVIYQEEQLTPEALAHDIRALQAE
jgi:cytochrome oxidase Cu insertion factor (SCO1/SenC/PrrC family)